MLHRLPAQPASHRAGDLLGGVAGNPVDGDVVFEPSEWVAHVKKVARFSPKKTPGTHAWRTCLQVTRLPVDRT